MFLPYIVFVTTELFTGNLSSVAYSGCQERATELKFTNGVVYPRLAGFNVTYNLSRPFVGPTGLLIADNETALRNSTLYRSLWDAGAGCVSSSSTIWSGLGNDSSFEVNTNVSETPGPHCDGFYSNTTLTAPFLPWTSVHPVDGASVSDCGSTVAGWEGASVNGKTCDNQLPLLCVFDPRPSTLAIATLNLAVREIIGKRAVADAKCAFECLSSEKSAALLYYEGESGQFPSDFLYKNGMTGVSAVTVSSGNAADRVTLFSDFSELNETGLRNVSESFFTGSQGLNCNNFTSRSGCSIVTLNFGQNETTCLDFRPNVLCACYNEAWMTYTPTQNPTKSPTSSKPTKSPSTSPTTSTPSKSPSSSLPTKAPTTASPSKSPTSSLPTKTPTNVPTL